MNKCSAKPEVVIIKCLQASKEVPNTTILLPKLRERCQHAPFVYLCDSVPVQEQPDGRQPDPDQKSACDRELYALANSLCGQCFQNLKPKIDEGIIGSVSQAGT